MTSSTYPDSKTGWKRTWKIPQAVSSRTNETWALKQLVSQDLSVSFQIAWSSILQKLWHPSPQRSPLPASHLVSEVTPGVFPGTLAVAPVFILTRWKMCWRPSTSFPHHPLAPSAMEDTARALAAAGLLLSGCWVPKQKLKPEFYLSSCPWKQQKVSPLLQLLIFRRFVNTG